MTKFQKGKSGNPNGRPKGSKDKRTNLRELLDPHSEALIKKAVDMALAGDTTALRMCLERICSPIKSTGEAVNIGPLDGTPSEQGLAIIQAMGNGEISPSDATSMLQAMASQARVREADELEKRIVALEERKAANNG